MASKELKEYVKGLEAYIKDAGYTADLAEAYSQACDTAFDIENDVGYGKIVAKGAKRAIETHIAKETGGDVWGLDAYCHENDTQYGIMDRYWNVLRHEAVNKEIDSYLLYLERYRPPEERFYLPRRGKFVQHGYIGGLQDLLDDKLDILSISSVPGSGKAQPLDSKVLTPTGFVRMGDVQIGMEVISGTGKPCEVLGVFPQGKKPTYEVVFDDGSKCKCSDEHLWKIQDRSDRRSNRYRIIPLSDMLDKLRVSNGNRKNYSVDHAGKIEFREKKLLLHPYVMGAFLGNACFSGMTFSSNDDFVIEKVSELLPEGYCINGCNKYNGNLLSSKVKEILQSYGLKERHSYDKFIPKDYLYASYENRLWLLRGLLDTDGYSRECVIEYTTVSETLARDIVELVHSLGGYASETVKKAHYKQGEEIINCRDAYRIFICFPQGVKPFWLPRKAEKYNPKRKELKRFISEVNYIGEEECQCIYISDPSHLYITDDYIVTHNTSLGEMFMSGFMGWNPDVANLFSSHSGHVTRMVYDVMCNIIGVDVKEGKIAEYAWREIFPEVTIEKVNANEQEINLGHFKPFKTLTCRAIGASQTGVTRCEGILYCDDLCSGLEEALSKPRLDKLWATYGSDLKTRKKKGRYGWSCKELHIATRWSVWDVIGRLQRQYEGDKRCRFVAVPDIDPDTGESNFEYSYGVGFDVKYFEDMQKTLDPITYACLFKNKPVEREGQLYHPDQLRRYGSLPESPPDAIWAFCDTKDTGNDYNCLGVFRQYGQDYYLVAVVFRNIDPLVLDELNARCLVDNGVQIAEFESNKEGSRTADKVQSLVNEMGGGTVIQKKYSTVNKETRIIVNSPWVVNNVLFPMPESAEYPDGYRVNSEMGQFMAHLCSYSQLAKNPNDDAPDMVSMLAVRMGPVLGGENKVEAVRNPFRRAG